LGSLKSFKDFLARASIVDLAVAVVMGTALTVLVTKFTDSVIQPLINRVGAGKADHSGLLSIGIGGGQHIDLNVALNAGINFVLVGAVVYFLIVLPYSKVRRPNPASNTRMGLLKQIRDLIAHSEWEISPAIAHHVAVDTRDMSVVVSGIGKAFGSVQALRDVSFEVGRGEVVALLGPNGAGKTTMVDILSTLTRPDRGSATIAGFDVVHESASVRRSIMLTGQQVALDEVLTGRENLVLFGRLQGLSKKGARSRAEELLHAFDLVYAADRRLGTYSGGMRRRIDIACGLVVRPEVVFLDEPTTGLDPRSRQTIWELVSGFKDLGISTLLTTQYLEEADSLSDRIVVIDHGQIVAEGTADQLKERTGGTYCEIVPRDLNDLPAIADALGSLIPPQTRAALTASSDRIAMPAPRGPATLVEALARLNDANIELHDIGLRRPSLDDVFLALTRDNSAVTPSGNPVIDAHEVSTPIGSDRRHRMSDKGGRHRLPDHYSPTRRA
jgi:ABC-2 type transport system ATP-binding protein